MCIRDSNTSHLKYIQDGTALDITEYLDNDLKETTETLYDGFLAPTTVEGKTYGILNMGSNYVPGGFTYREAVSYTHLVDPTTDGVGDSKQALTYTEPKK